MTIFSRAQRSDFVSGNSKSKIQNPKSTARHRRAKRIKLIAVLLGITSLPVHSFAVDKLTLSSTNPTALELDHMVAKEKGFYAKENLDVDVQFMQPDLVIKTLLAGSVDLARSGTHFGVIAASRGGEIKVIGGSNYGYPYEVISQPQFKTLADLKGQRIAGASLASITTTIFKDVMLRNGIAPTAYTLVFVGGSRERFQAVASGAAVASLAEAPPFNFRSVDAGRRILLKYSEVIKNLQYTSFFAQAKALAQNRPLFSRFMRAISQAMHWLNDPANENQAVELLTQRLKIDPATATQTYKFMIPDNKSFRLEGAIDGPGMAEMVRLLFEDKMIAERQPWENFVDPAFLPAGK
jgi:ABC-type nitrate/sulfonate/bicarbonate transport system substrate-binding protein